MEMIRAAETRIYRLRHRWLLLAFIVAVGATAGWYAYNHFWGADDESDLASNEHLIPVRTSSLLSEISIYGSVAFSNKKDLTFGSSGFIDEIMVSEGEIVSEGQPLARIDPESVANLSRAIVQAQIDHAKAISALEDAKRPSLQVAEAEAAVTNAALELHDARETLTDLLSPKAEEIAGAEATLAEAALEAQTARESLNDLLTPKEEFIASAQDEAAKARIELRDAELALGNDLATALDTLEIAERDLAVARMNLDALDNNNQLKNTRDAYEDERADYSNVIYKWTGVKATDEELTMAPAEIFAALNFDPERVYDRDYTLFPDGRIADNPDTRWNELKVFGWRALYPTGNIIEARCDQYTFSPIRQSGTDSSNDEFCIERDMRNAYDALVSARADLLAEEAQYNDSLAAAQEALTQAEMAHTDAQEALARLTEGSIGAARLQSRYDKAQADYEAANRNLADLKNPDAVEVENRRRQLAYAQAKREAAAEALDTVVNPASEEVAAKRSQFALAQTKLDGANVALQRLNDWREMQIALQEVSIEAAQAKIDGETRRYDSSTLKAPWDGYISQIPVEEGKEIEPFEVILTVINTGIVQIEGNVDEIDILSLHRDAAAVVTLDALPDRELEGIVSSIGSTPITEQGIVRFAVKVEVKLPDDVTLQEGLSAIAKVAIEEKSGLIIPLEAVQYGPEGPYARMMSEEGKIVERTVTLGDNDGYYTIVERGLREGDRILMKVLDDSEFDAALILGSGVEEEADES